MDDPPAAMNVADIKVIGVIGAGQMGSGRTDSNRCWPITRIDWPNTSAATALSSDSS